MKPTVSTIFLGILFLFAPAAGQEADVVKAVNCFVCSSDNSTECQTILEGQTTHLEECASGKCFVMEEEDPITLGKIVLTRGCAEETKCIGGMKFPLCCECGTDGCNNKILCSPGSDTFSMALSCLKFASIVILMVL